MESINSVRLTIGQASQLLGVSINTLRRWEKEDRIKLPARDRESAWRTYSMADIEEIRKVGGKLET